MNEQEKIWFEALTKDREENERVLGKVSVRGVKDKIVDQYSDQAHFIYELLQNANDAQATVARFTLEQERLVFSHNGSRHFTLSDPASEEEDSLAGTFGDINAITSIGNSSKKDESNTIGKFGIGFKAVLQYTTTPHIYDRDFRFMIERFVVPVLLEHDFPTRKPSETLFVFPFDHPDCEATEAYDDISLKLRNLSFPLLFLSHLKRIELELGGSTGRYEKRIERRRKFADATAELVCLTQSDGEEDKKERLWLFSRESEDGHKCAVGFFLNGEKRLCPPERNIPAFCFFPTKENTGLNFIIHAPFLLNSTREGIRAGDRHNRDMVECLAQLAADAIFYLKEIGEEKSPRLVDDSILDIIPYDPNEFSDIDDRSTISFLPFYESIRELFKHEEIIPTRDGYTTSNNAYWASVRRLTEPELFSDKQLGQICDNEEAHWVFVSRGRDATQGALSEYIESLVRTFIDEDAIIKGRKGELFYDNNRREWRSHERIKGITSKFIEAQDDDWLHEFYAWLHESPKRADAARKRFIFLNQNGEAVAAVDATGKPTLFLPSEEVDENAEGYNFVHRSLLENEKTREFIQSIGVKEPATIDYIYNIILPQYEDDGVVDTDSHFKTFFRFYCKGSSEEREELVRLIKGCEFLTYYDDGDPQAYRDAADTMYLPTQELRKWFETKPGKRFIALDEYKEMEVCKGKHEDLLQFFKALGVQTEIIIYDEDVPKDLAKADIIADYWEDRGIPKSESQSPDEEEKLELERHRFNENKGRGYHKWTEGVIEGCREIVEHIAATGDKEKSRFLWKKLLDIIVEKGQPSVWLARRHNWSCKGKHERRYHSSDARRLLRLPWLFNRDGEFLSPSNLTKSALAEGYNTQSEAARTLMKFLGIQDEDDALSSLPEDVRQGIELAKSLKAMGFNESHLEQFQKFMEREARLAAAAQARKEMQANSSAGLNDFGDDGAWLNRFMRDDGDGVNTPAADVSPGGLLTSDARRPRRSEVAITKNIARCVMEPLQTAEEGRDSVEEEAEDDDADQDEYTPRVVDYGQLVRRETSKSAANIRKIARKDELQKRAQVAAMYSFARFMAVLEMECLNSEEQDGSKKISISFAKVERERGAQRTLVLRHPSRNIPHAVEELDDFPLEIYMANGEKKKLEVEAASVKSSDKLHVKLKSADDISKVDDFSSVQEATINVESPAFLIKALRKRFEELGLEDDFDMQANLCENIEFVFGPPGTGKTTHLARNVLLPLMQDGADCKVLVLAPTNKAADVLARRIMEEAGDADSCRQWLVRFGTTPDEKSGLASVYKDRAFDILAQRRSVVVTTVARFAYDGFTRANGKPYLRNIEWDYIVIDEASMIPIANIIYPLYKQKPQKFIIAGDPFQIEPITRAALWKDMNIYTMVGLDGADSFKNPRTEPHSYKVERLETQYRSIPEIGSVFSNFAYNGILRHHRTSASQRPLNLGDDCGIKTLNIIKFPVSRYEGIYRAKHLQRSSYQIYSALFTYEYVLHLAREIAEHNPESCFKIGVIAPYRAQADLIDRLLASATLPKEVQVQADTIHGFQGDECDIIFAVFNTPPNISASKAMFLNKRNIINVAISRARDYLFIVMPDDETEGIENLTLVKRVELLAKGTDACAEFVASDLEMLMFGEAKYLEHKTFSTSHQSVNVYGLPLPEHRYEVRVEDSAVDIQIHERAQRAAG